MLKTGRRVGRRRRKAKTGEAREGGPQLRVLPRDNSLRSLCTTMSGWIDEIEIEKQGVSTPSIHHLFAFHCLLRFSIKSNHYINNSHPGSVAEHHAINYFACYKSNRNFSN